MIRLLMSEMALNAQKYLVEQARESSRNYTDL